MNLIDSFTTDAEDGFEMPLATERLLLRRFIEADAVAVELLLNDRELAANSRSIDFPYPQGAAVKWIERHQTCWQEGTAFVFAVEAKPQYLPLVGEASHGPGTSGRGASRLIGAIEIQINENDHQAELGYWIGRDFRGLGFCSEAAIKVVEFGFEKIGLNKITSHHMARNSASGRVLEKIGMHREGYLRRHVRKWGVFEDVILYGMLSSDPRAGA
jgi:ribosomal-protein-alanine N-acetyltransferase